MKEEGAQGFDLQKRLIALQHSLFDIRYSDKELRQVPLLASQR